MEVFAKYFRRLLQNNAAQVFGSAGRNTDPNGSYQILVTEVQKLRTDPQQADKIAEAISSSEGDLFRDFEASINALGITHLSLTPTVAALVNPDNVPKVVFLVTAGEALTERVRRQWAGRGLYQGTQ